jgi:hypothetical protein
MDDPVEAALEGGLDHLRIRDVAADDLDRCVRMGLKVHDPYARTGSGE